MQISHSIACLCLFVPSVALQAQVVPDLAKAPEPPKIRVQSINPITPWEVRMDAAMARPLSMHIDAMAPADVITALEKASGLDFIVDPDEVGDPDLPKLTLHADRVPLHEILARLCKQVRGSGYCVVEDGICIGSMESAPAFFSSRIYDLAALLDRVGQEAEEDDEQRLLDLVQTFSVANNHWTYDRAEVSLDVWRGLLIVNQVPQVHREIERLLNGLLNRGLDREVWQTKERRAMEQKLALRVQLKAENETLGSLASRIAKAYELPILTDEDAASRVVSLQLDDVTLSSALRRLSGLAQTQLAIDDNGARFGELDGINTQTLIHDAHAVMNRMASADQRSEARERIQQTLLQHAEPTLGGIDDARIEFWHDLAIVRAPASMQASAARVIDVLAVALRR